MKHLFYENWYKNRVNKIIDIFGKSWFKQKEILELGSCHGDIGIKLLELGSKVHFSDVRQEYLDTIISRLKEYNFNPTVSLINQNNDYSFNKKFDLVLNLGVLYHLDNWKNDLKCSLSHSNIMILESKVCPIRNTKDTTIDTFNFNYGSYNCKTPVFTQESVENELTNLGCKFIRFDDSALNCNGWFNENFLDLHIYDWTYEKYERGVYNIGSNIHFRRFWLVLN